MELLVFIRQAYGKKRAYPADDKAKILAGFGKVTGFTMDQVEQLKKVGFTFRVVPDPTLSAETL